MLKFVRPIAFSGAALTAITLLACSDKNETPTTPTPTPTPVGTTIAAPVLRGPTGESQLDTLHPTLEVANAVTTGTPGTVRYRFEVSELDDFPEGSRTFMQDDVPQGAGATTSLTVGPSDLIPNFKYFWRARATNGPITSAWSGTETFRTRNTGFKSGGTVFDPLTTGNTVGQQHGGRFIEGQGWQSLSFADGIDYDIPTCTNCRVEFDVTNFNEKEGEGVQKDLKWFTMGDATSFPNFGAFRDHPYKMHLEQRGDSDRGMKLIWRNGSAGEGDPGDHTQRRDDTEDWNGGTVYHFVFEWTPNSLSVTVNGHNWFRDGLARPFDPPNHRVSLGCYPRGETMLQAIWRNVQITPR